MQLPRNAPLLPPPFGSSFYEIFKRALFNCHRADTCIQNWALHSWEHNAFFLQHFQKRATFSSEFLVNVGCEVFEGLGCRRDDPQTFGPSWENKSQGRMRVVQTLFGCALSMPRAISWIALRSRMSKLRGGFMEEATRG